MRLPCGRDMRRKLSNAPAPTGSLPIGHAEPESKSQPKVAEPKQATQTYYRYLQAIHRKDRRAAEFYAQKCRTEGLPETQLAELALLDTYQTRGTRSRANQKTGS